MLKVLIVDDEKSIREGLQYVIEWESYGYTVVEIAANGIIACELIKKLNPDVVITDVNMPEMNGLELIQNVIEFAPHIKFIILSGYDEFEYAKKAIHLKVEGYLLKPVEESELIELLDRIKKELEKSSVNKKQKWHSMLSALANGNYTGIGEMETVIADTVDPKGTYYYALVELDEDDTAFMAVKHHHKADEQLAKLLNVIVGFIGENNRFNIITEGVTAFGLMIDSTLLELKGNDVKQFASRLQREIKNEGLMASVMTGKKVDRVFDIYLSKESINVCRRHKFYFGGGQTYLYEELADKTFKDSINELGMIEELTKEIIRGSGDNIGSKTEVFFNQLTAEMVSPETVKIFMSDLVMNLMKAVDEMGGDTARILAKFSSFNKVRNITINTTRLFIQELCGEISEYIAALKKKKTIGIIGEITDYINEHYKDEIDLQWVAKVFYMNASYFGQLFKKKMGITFNAYLNQVRMEAAKKLLLSGNHKIYEIAQSVGYKDPNYFCIKFEEFEHVSPTKFREMEKQ